MKTLAGSLVVLSAFALAAVGCGVDEADDLTQSDDALLTCDGWHKNGPAHRGHKHHRHHHGHGHGTGGGTGGQPHATGMAGMGGTTGMAGSTGMAGTTGTAGATGMGGSGGAVDPRCTPLDGTVSMWHADGDYDDAIGANDGMSGGDVSFAPGIDNQGFNLNGNIGAYVEVPHDASLMIGGPITIDAWINESALGGRIVDKAQAFGNNGYLLDILGGHLRMFIGTDQILSTDPLPAGMWVHVAGVFNGNGMGVYINGALSAESVTAGHAIISNSLPVRFGADSNGDSQFVGVIDEPRIFNRALTADEIALLFWQGTHCQ